MSSRVRPGGPGRLRVVGLIALAWLVLPGIGRSDDAEPPPPSSSDVQLTIYKAEPFDITDRRSRRRLAKTIDELQSRLPEVMAEGDTSLMEMIFAADAMRKRMADQVARVQLLEEQAEAAGDKLLYQCLAAREKRARQLAEAADRAYWELLKGITSESVPLIRHNLEVLALMPRLETEFHAKKAECVGTSTGVFVEYPTRK